MNPKIDEDGACTRCGAGPGPDWDGIDDTCINCDKEDQR
jgi:hypothetical protein